MVKLSVVIITLNEENVIERCIDSVQAIADEIFVVDSFSTDRTKEICEAKGVKFIENKFEGHIQQKNYAAANATYEHILSLYADEALSSILRKSISKIKENWTEEGYAMNRLNNYCGTWIRTCGWYPDRKIRLFKKDAGTWGGDNPHDFYELYNNKKAGFLKGDILHFTYATVEAHKIQVKRFAEIAARVLIEKGKKPSPIKLIINPLSKFIGMYFFKLGFTDGLIGFRISYQAAKSTYHKYAIARKG